MDNLLCLINSARSGSITTAELKKKSQYIYASHLSSSVNKKFLDVIQFIYFVHLMYNKLLVTIRGGGFQIFAISAEAISYPVSGYWQQTQGNTYTGLPCATWGENCSFIIASGYGNSLVSLDGASLQEIEEISLYEDSRRQNIRWATMGHEISPYSSNIVAVACTDGKVPLIDLRTGQVESGVKNHLIDFSCVTWSKYHENIIAVTSNSSESLQIWDTRHLRKNCMSIHYPSCVSPDMKFVDYGSLVSLRNTYLDVIDIFREEICFSHPINDNTIRFRRRKKFAVNSDIYPQLLYVPSGEDIEIFNLRRKCVINSYRKTLFPVEMVVMNECFQELYTFSDDEVLVLQQDIN